MHKTYYRMVNIFFDENVKGDEARAAREILYYIQLGYDPICAQVDGDKVIEAEYVGDDSKYCAQLCKTIYRKSK